MHNPANNNCPRNADPRNESCDCARPVVQVDAVLWQDIKFVIEGISFMDTLRRTNPELQKQFKNLAWRIENGK